MRMVVFQRALAAQLILMISFTLAPARAPGDAHFIFQRSSDGRWQGSCTVRTEIFQSARFTLGPADSITSGTWRGDLGPATVWAGIEVDTPYVDSTIEMEIYPGGFGVLRSQDGWFAVSHFSKSGQVMRFDVDTAREVQPSGLDRDIIKRAASILSSEAAWNRADNRKCEPTATRWSIYCAMESATIQVTGGFHHRRPALQLIRAIVEERSVGRKYHHRLMDYNNDPSTSFRDVAGLFSEALHRLGN
jgi:hypothetical protein